MKNGNPDTNLTAESTTQICITRWTNTVSRAAQHRTYAHKGTLFQTKQQEHNMTSWGQFNINILKGVFNQNIEHNWVSNLLMPYINNGLQKQTSRNSTDWPRTKDIETTTPQTSSETTTQPKDKVQSWLLLDIVVC